jgi:hypothetical protein
LNEELAMSRIVLMGGVALVASFAMGATAIGAAQQPKPAPQFMFVNSGWLGQGGTNFIAPKSGPGPIKNDPKFPYVGNNDTPGNQSTERVGDANDPILQPWAAEVVRQHNDFVHKGKRSFVAQARCWPGGGPAQLLFPAEPIYFIQQSKEVHIIWQRDHHVRRVKMNVPHDANAKPSWFGDSVGHYEGDTLVVDTTNFVTHQYHFVDNFRTPHSEQLHVVERWRTIDDGKRLEVEVTVEDPKAFTTPWKATRIWQKVDRGPMLESVCAENNINPFNLDEYPMPEAKTPDF